MGNGENRSTMQTFLPYESFTETAKVLATMYYLGDGTLKDAALATTIIPPPNPNNDPIIPAMKLVDRIYTKNSISTRIITQSC